MANNEIKTSAEIYREQRKERLAKAAKKKNSPKHDKTVKIIVKIICIVLAVALVGWGAFNVLMDVFFLPQKLLKVATYDNAKVSVAEYNYYYMSLYNRVANMSQQYDSYYGSGYGAMYTGFDYNADPAEQDYTAQDAPEGVKTWADYFKASAATSAAFYQEMYKNATSDETVKANFTYSKEELEKQITDAITTLETNAKQADFSLNNYISKVCGEGLNEKSYTNLLKRDYIVSQYLTWYQENAAGSLTAKEVKDYYGKNKDTFDKVYARAFTFSYAKTTDENGKETQDYTKAQANKLANEFLGKITNEASFIKLAREYATNAQKETYKSESATAINGISKADLASSAKMADWLFNAKRAVGDKAVIEDADSSIFYVVYLTKLPAPDTSDAGVSVRHILFQAATTAEDGTALDEVTVAENAAAAKKKAEDCLKKFKAGDKTEDSFAALAKELTEDEGSKETGGLYEDVNASSSLVPEFLNWSIDTARKPGDVEIVKTDYGYHVMYFVKKSGMKKWESDVRNEIASTDYTEFVEKAYDDIDEKISKNDKLIDYFAAKTQSIITANIKNSAKNSVSTVS